MLGGSRGRRTRREHEAADGSVVRGEVNGPTAGGVRQRPGGSAETVFLGGPAETGRPTFVLKCTV